MGNTRWGLGFRIIFISIISVSILTDTCLGALNITATCSRKESLALIKFKNSVKDINGMLSSWVGNDCCQWESVTCDNSTGNVVGLYLRGYYADSFSKADFDDDVDLAGDEMVSPDYYLSKENYLVGDDLDSSLGELRQLEYLDLSGNNFRASHIPEFIGTFERLTPLNISSAGFGGLIPSHFGNLSYLKVLDVSNMFPLVTIDDMAWVSGLSSLEHLNLNHLDLSEAQKVDRLFYIIPSLLKLSLSSCSISNAQISPRFNSSTKLANIKHLDLSVNDFRGQIPVFLQNMTSLAFLNLSGNNLNSTVPIMPNLLKLDLSSNMFKHVGIWRHCHLKELIVSYNYLEEDMVVSTTNVSECSQYAFERLYLNDNYLNGSLSEFLGRLTNLRDLDLSDNNLAGPLPEALGKLSLLESLDLSRNQFNGSIPESLGSLMGLKELLLQSNRLTGPIPASLARLVSLQRLSVSSNMLNGTIPTSFGQLSRLVYLDVSNNSLIGIVSEAHFASLSVLKYLDIADNNKLAFNISREWVPPFQLRIAHLGSCNVSDEFPKWFRTRRNLEELVLSNASLFGPLPIWLQKMPIIHVLDLSHNKLTGPLTNLPSGDPFKHIRHNGGSVILVQENLFTGSIPKSLCTIIDLEVLDLSGNKLSGKVPKCLGKLERLSEMILSSNRLSGLIPSSLGRRSSLQWLQLNDNNFSGELPRELMNLRYLFVLDLGENKISGNIPEWIGENLTLLVLRLRKNSFTGRLPQTLCKMPNLNILDLAHNNLSGSIPHCFGELQGMSTTDKMYPLLSYNIENVMQVIKGVALEYKKAWILVVNMNLSCNKLVGEIPHELTKLHALMGLNLSHNHLSGVIPKDIGNMESLFSLDFSGNELSGVIPPSISALNFLSHLNLSHNYLSGQIPIGKQLQTLTDPSIYAGNRDLYGAPLTKNCSNHEDTTATTNKRRNEDDHKQKKVLFYLDIMSGFATGFWGIIGVLMFKKQWRHKLFMFTEATIDKIHVAVVVRISKMKRGRIDA